MGLTVHFEVLNQLGTPMLYSSTLATRPAAGITGRIFYRTDSPFGIYRDNGVTWDLISSVGSATSVTGTGTATQVAYWDTSSSITSNSGLYFDATNIRLGINTSTPGSALDAHQAGGTIIQANSTTLANSLMSFQLQGTGKWQIGNVYSAGSNYFRIYDQLNSVERIVQKNTGELDITGWEVLTNTQTGLAGNTTTGFNNSFSNNYTYNSGISTIASFNSIGVLVDNNYNFSGSNIINQTSYNSALVLRSNMTFGSAASSITYTQATGIRALSNKQSIYIQSGANSGTISHYANLQIFGDQGLGAGKTTFTNRYQILLNDFDEFSAGNTYTNRWAIYQDGSSNTNYFSGKIITGTSNTIGIYQLDVTGIIRGTGNISAVSGVSKGIYSYYTLTATSNNDILTAIDVESSYTIGSFTGVTTWSARLQTGLLVGITPITGTSSKLQFSSSDGTIAVKNTTSGNFSGINMYDNANTLTGTIQSGGTASGSPYAGNIIIGARQSTGRLQFVRGVSATLSATLFSSGNLIIQDGGTHTDISSAMLQISSTTKGFLPPVMTTTQKNAISTPTAGLIVFDTTLAKLCVYASGAWQTITSV